MALSLVTEVNFVGTSGTNYATPSIITFSVGKLYLIWVETRHATSAPTPIAEGNGVDTWVMVNTINMSNQGVGGAARRLTLFKGVGNENATHYVNFQYGGASVTGISGTVQEWSGDHTPEIVQSITGGTTAGDPVSAAITLPTPIKGNDTGNAVVAAFVTDPARSFTPGTDFTEAVDNSNIVVEYDIAPTDSTADTTFSAAAGWIGIAAEIYQPPSVLIQGTAAITAAANRTQFPSASITGSSFITSSAESGSFEVPVAKVYLETTADTWVDLTHDLMRGSVNRGRSNELDRYNAGTATLVFRNTSRNYDPVNVDGPYHGYLDVRHRMYIEAWHNNETYPIFFGYIDGIDPTRSLANTMGTTTIKLSDFFKVLNKAAVNGTDFPSELSGERIDRILDLVDLDPSLRAIDAGETTLQAMTDVSSTLLSHVQTVAQTEFGDLFVRADGVVVFRSRNATAGEASQATFGEASDELHYNSLTPQYNDSLIRNPVSVDRVGGVKQTVEDSALTVPPPTGYGINHYSLSGTYHNSDAAALDAANYILNRYKLPSRRVTNLGFGPVPNDEGPEIYPQILSRELTDKITVVERPMGIGTEIVQVSTIEGVSHEFSPGQWKTKWNVSPADTVPYWRAGLAGFSEAGTHTRVAY